MMEKSTLNFDGAQVPSFGGLCPPADLRISLDLQLASN